MTNVALQERHPDLRTETTSARLLSEAMAGHGYDDEDIGLALASETNFEEAVTEAILRLDELEWLAGAAKAISKKYQERADGLEARRERLRDVIAEALERSHAPLPLKLPVATVGLTSPAPSAVVLDANLVPAEYMRTKVTKSPDMRSITLDLREGKPVEGCALRNSRRTLSVRRA